jgi:hypothetical protein
VNDLVDAAAQYQNGGSIRSGLYRRLRREAIHYRLRGAMSRQNFSGNPDRVAE